MEKRKTANKVYILELVYVLNFSWKNNFDFLEHISQKGIFSLKQIKWTPPALH